MATSVLCPGPYGFWEVHTALDGPRINQSNREFLSCYTIMFNINTGCFDKIYPILMLHFEKPRALIPLCTISYRSKKPVSFIW